MTRRRGIARLSSAALALTLLLWLFARSGTLPPGQSRTYRTGSGTETGLGGSPIYDDDEPTEGARLTTPYGTLEVLCSEVIGVLGVGEAAQPTVEPSPTVVTPTTAAATPSPTVAATATTAVATATAVAPTATRPPTSPPSTAL